MKNLFISKANTKVHPNDIIVRHHKFTSYGDKSLQVFRPRI